VRSDGETSVNRTHNRRMSPRQNLALNVAFLSEDDERQHTRKGTTANVSAGGVYFHTSEWQALEAGKEIGLRLSGLSGLSDGGPLFRDLRVKAIIVRVDAPEKQTTPFTRGGIAARFSEQPCFEVYRWSE